MFVVAGFFFPWLLLNIFNAAHMFLLSASWWTRWANKIFICQKFAQAKQFFRRLFVSIVLLPLFFTYLFYLQFYLLFPYFLSISYIHICSLSDVCIFLQLIQSTVLIPFCTQKKCEFTQQGQYKSHVNSVYVNLRFDAIVWITRKIMCLRMI